MQGLTGGGTRSAVEGGGPGPGGLRSVVRSGQILDAWMQWELGLDSVAVAGFSGPHVCPGCVGQPRPDSAADPQR